MAVPRRALLPPYMQQPIWLELADAIDSLWGQSVEQQLNALGKMRDTWILNNNLEVDIQDRVLLDPAKYDNFDPTTEMLRLNLLGLPITSPNFVATEDLVRFNRHMGQHWYDKGLGDFIDFLGYCLNVKADMVNLWTEDYGTFVPEGQQGTPVWDAGTWYPTTHVQVTFDPGKYLGFPVVAFLQLFYDVANYNLVIEKLISDTRIDINCWVALGVVTSVYHVWPMKIEMEPELFGAAGKIEKVEHWIHSA